MLSTDAVQIVTADPNTSPSLPYHSIQTGVWGEGKLEQKKKKRTKLNGERNSWSHAPKSLSQKDISAERRDLWMLTRNEEDVMSPQTQSPRVPCPDGLSLPGLRVTDRFRNLQRPSTDAPTHPCILVETPSESPIRPPLRRTSFLRPLAVWEYE